ncbi:MAG: 1-acyl-sn-glycerol-3-phosphate acyltransferase [Phyllobacteriaceae bacterium]|nr:1-acyl-sn-glycerol-3-phosphate acyltransferase [Phyllobacteriaceae bacterium]
MSGTIALPVWVVVVAGALALIGLIDRLLTPAARWFFKRRVNRAIEELNTKLQLKIRPFGLTRRKVLIDRLANDSAVVRAAEEHARAENMPREVAMDIAHRYAREIVPSFNAYAYFRVGARLARALSTALYRVRLGYMDSERLKTVDPDATVIFVINHRSNMDYVLVTYLASASAALSYAVGEWARVPVLQQLIRSMGAYFIRRNSRDGLYRKVLARYVHMATAAGVTQAVFPEGGLTRDGKLRPVKLGLLSYIAAGWEPGGRDVVFVPVGLNYDRVLEDRSLVAEIDGPPPRVSTWIKTQRTLAFLWRNLRLRLAGRWHRFGYACVSFGQPVSLAAHFAAVGMAEPHRAGEADRNAAVEALGDRLMTEIARVIPALPVSLVALALTETSDAPLDELALKARVGETIDRLAQKGAHIHIPAPTATTR